MTPEDKKDAVRFLAALSTPYAEQGAGLSIELRAFMPGRNTGAAARAWRPLTPTGFSDTVDHAANIASRLDVYIGVLPRVPRGGGADALRVCAWLWCDVDGGAETPRESLALLRSSCETHGLPAPDICVVSGGGIHAYWRLSRNTPCATREEQDRLRRVLRRLVRAVGGELENAHADIASAEPARVLRLPGTFNHKMATPRLVRLLRCEPDAGTAQPLVWWAANLPPEPLPPKPKPREEWRGSRERYRSGEAVSLPPRTVALMQTGAPRGQIHNAMKKAATAAMKNGLDDEAGIRIVIEQVVSASGLSPHDPDECRNIDNLTRWTVQNVQPDYSRIGGSRATPGSLYPYDQRSRQPTTPTTTAATGRRQNNCAA